MARPREFDPDAALATAIEVFWEKGFYNGSVDEVVRRTGVAKYGIYGTFGGKRELFLKALEQYGQDRKKDIQRSIRAPDASLPEVREFFANASKLMTKKNARRGCLMVNTGVELGGRDREMRDIVTRFFNDTAKVFQTCLERAVARGELAPEKDVTAISRYLATEVRVALTLAASGHSRTDIDQHFEVALQVLD